MTERIVRLNGNGSTPTAGVVAYSEGTADDLNKVQRVCSRSRSRRRGGTPKYLL